MAVSIVGIVMNIIMLIVIIILIVLGFIYRRYLQKCETKQSEFCYSVTCPCDTPSGSTPTGPCFGYTMRSAGSTGTWYCSNAPYTKVDDNGKPI